jgi:hypothetical protein
VSVCVVHGDEAATTYLHGEEPVEDGQFRKAVMTRSLPALWAGGCASNWLVGVRHAGRAGGANRRRGCRSQIR